MRERAGNQQCCSRLGAKKFKAGLQWAVMGQYSIDLLDLNWASPHRPILRNRCFCRRSRRSSTGGSDGGPKFRKSSSGIDSVAETAQVQFNNAMSFSNLDLTLCHPRGFPNEPPLPYHGHVVRWFLHMPALAKLSKLPCALCICAPVVDAGNGKFGPADQRARVAAIKVCPRKLRRAHSRPATQRAIV